MDIGSIGDVTVEVDGLKFTLRPKEYTDLLFWQSKSREMGISDHDTQALGFVYTEILLRIKSWEGIEMDDKPAPCTMQTKNKLFSQRPDIINKIIPKVQEIEGEQEKNSSTSQDG